MSARTKLPAPAPDEWSEPFWTAAREGRLAVPRCRACRTLQYPPDVCCRRCQSTDLDLEVVSGRGKVTTFAVYVRQFVEAFDVPYVLAMVSLDEDPLVRLMTNIVDTPLEHIVVGMPVEVVFDARGGWAIPQFRARRRSVGS